MVNDTPRSLVVIPRIGRTMAQCLVQIEENSRIVRRNLMGSDFSQDRYATASGSLGHQGAWNPGQAIEGPIHTNTGHGARGSAAFEQDNSGLAMSATPESFNPESIAPNAQSNFAGYGMQSGSFDNQNGPATSPQYGFDSQYRGPHDHGIDFNNAALNNTGMETAMNGYRYPVDDRFHYTNDSNTVGFSNANLFGYPYQSNPGFPVSNERSATRTMTPSNISGYPNSSRAQPSHTNRANVGPSSPSNFDDRTFNEEVAGSNVDQFMGNMDAFNYDPNTSMPGTWGPFDDPNYSL